MTQSILGELLEREDVDELDDEAENENEDLDDEDFDDVDEDEDFNE